MSQPMVKERTVQMPEVRTGSRDEIVESVSGRGVEVSRMRPETVVPIAKRVEERRE